MVYASKSYKVQTFYRLLYSCTYDVLDATKSPLLKAYLIKDIGQDAASKLDKYSFNGLFEKMVEQLKETIENSDYVEVSRKVRFDDRYQLLRAIEKPEMDLQEHTIMNFRIDKSTISDIQYMKRVTLGEVIELSIMNFIVNCDQKTFDLIVLSYKTI